MTTITRPKVIVHTAVSVDGRTTGFEVDMGQFCELAGTWDEDATLAGCDTLLAATPENAVPPEKQPAPKDDLRPLLVVTDCRGRLHAHEYWRRQPHWRDMVMMISETSPQEYRQELEEAGITYVETRGDRVDLPATLEWLVSDRGVKTVRIESGGMLSGVLLGMGLVDELSVMVHPLVVNGKDHRSLGYGMEVAKSRHPVRLRLSGMETLANGVIWMRYDVIND